MEGFLHTARAGIRALWSSELHLPTRRNLAMVAAWLVIVNLFALMALNRLNISPDTALEWMSPETFKVQPSWDIISIHNRWDSYWYLDIAEKGYYLRGENTQANVVFFPLYPLLVSLAGHLTGGDLVLAGWMVSSLFLALAVAMLTRLTQVFHPDIDPLRPAMFLLVYPTAFFLNAVYTESLFLFLSLAMVYCALKRNFLMAGVWAALASATRIAGLFLFVVMFIEFVQASGWRALLTRRVWPLALAPSGLVAFFAYHWVSFGNFFIFLNVQKTFGRDFKSHLNDYLTLHNNPDMVHTVMDLSYTALLIVLAILALRRFRPSYGLYMLVSLGVALSTGTALGIARYGMVMFPIYLIGAGIRSPVGRHAWWLASALLLALNMTQFVHHYWSG